MYDIIIIGAGIAGLTSAIYALRGNKKVLILEKKSYGGQIIESIEVDNYPGCYKINGFDLATNIYNQVKELGAEIKYEEVKEITIEKKVITNKDEYQAKSIIIATGVIPRKLDLEKEDQFIGKGISYCATCDGGFYKNKIVAVIGGGNTALEDALYLSNLCKEVILIHRRDTFRGEENKVNLLKQKHNVKIVSNSIISKINGKEKVTSIDIINTNTNKKKNILIEGLFIAIGRIPNNDNFKELIELDENGYIKSNDCETNVDGIFTAGDTRTKELRQLTTAASDGSIAAMKAIQYLDEI